ncbi:MAG: hypothetical protein U1F35_10005 [Steroidobacteraceae bacterium]
MGAAERQCVTGQLHENRTDPGCERRTGRHQLRPQEMFCPTRRKGDTLLAGFEDAWLLAKDSNFRIEARYTAKQYFQPFNS